MSHAGVRGDRNSLQVVVALQVAAEADPEDVERWSRQLRAELTELEIDDLAPRQHGQAPPGAKGTDVASLTEWLITMSASGGLLTVMVQTLRDWLGRRADANRITLTIDGDNLTLDSATVDERSTLIESFIREHARNRQS
jgi:Effector Associated Constant Component 1